MAGEESFTSRLEPVYGAEGLARAAASSVAVLGLGGVGSNCVEALARGGVGRLVLFDHDVVQKSNINRQAIAFESTVGQKKTEVMRAMVADINPAAQVEAHERFILAADVPTLLDGPCANVDYLVDAIDTVSAKLALAQEAERRGIRLISSMGAAGKTRPDCLQFADLYETQICPLCRIMRKEARKRDIRHLRVLYSYEQPVPTRACNKAKREGGSLGTTSFMPPIMGQMIAGEVLREIAGFGGERE